MHTAGYSSAGDASAQIRILTFPTDPPVVSAILLHLNLPHKPRPLSPGRGPPQSDLLTGLLDQAPAFDPTEPDAVPDFEFDQSPPRVLRVARRIGNPTAVCAEEAGRREAIRAVAAADGPHRLLALRLILHHGHERPELVRVIDDAREVLVAAERTDDVTP